MGAWGKRAFDNDTANDWASRLRGADRANGLLAVDAVLSDLERANARNISERVACRALAACEVLARLLGNPGYTNAYTRKVDSWVLENPLIPPSSLLARAEAAIDRILGEGSELRQLWDAGGGAEWRETVEDLRRRLRAARGTPSPSDNNES